LKAVPLSDAECPRILGSIDRFLRIAANIVFLLPLAKRKWTISKGGTRERSQSVPLSLYFIPRPCLSAPFGERRASMGVFYRHFRIFSILDHLFGRKKENLAIRSVIRRYHLRSRVLRHVALPRRNYFLFESFDCFISRRYPPIEDCESATKSRRAVGQ